MTVYHNNVPEDIVIELGKRLPQQSRVLDLGCGLGRNAIPLAKAGHLVEGRDNDSEEISKLLEYASAESVRVDTICTDLRNLRIGWRTWNAILAILILNQLSIKEGKILLENSIINVLPGGYLALVALTGNGDLPRLFNLNYYPSAKEVISMFSGWEIISQSVDVVPCKTKAIQSGLQNERLTLLAHKPIPL